MTREISRQPACERSPVLANFLLCLCGGWLVDLFNHESRTQSKLHTNKKRRMKRFGIVIKALVTSKLIYVELS